jgi:hypothetical protein
MRRNISVDAQVGKPSTSDVAKNVATIVFHWECPIGPDQAHSSDGWSNMQQCMNSERADRNAIRIILTIEPGKPLNKIPLK